MGNKRYRCDFAYLSGGWARDVLFEVDAAGDLAAVTAQARDSQAPRIGRYVLPGMPNLHSHAFQRALAGRAEFVTEAVDSFWTWREGMYALAARLDPGALEAVAAQLYVEMLKAGYTAVCEFHYVHHQADGVAYAPPAAMSHVLCGAADYSGIGLTLLPTLYMAGGIDGRALSPRQRRFGHAVGDFLTLVDGLRAQESAQRLVGIAFHSLRAVPEPALREVLDSEIGREGPIHIHIAEQTAEVEESLSVRGVRPVAWLMQNAPVDPRWCLVHATHLDPYEIEAIAASGAIVGLCPTTEANLGDGLFPLSPFLERGGAFGIGSDSHVSTSPIEELRWLEYGQRLVRQRRNVVARPGMAHVGENLWRDALVGGAQATHRRIGVLRAGQRADLLVLDDDAPELAQLPLPQVLDAFVFCGNRNLVRDVMVGGRMVVRDGVHEHEQRIAAHYRHALARLYG